MLSFPLIHTHISGFLAIPDVPLLFFTLCFLILYRKFLEKPSFLIAVLLAVVSAAMIYSKYHAFLVIGFTVLSNLKLLRNKYFWATVGLTIVLLLPHVFWQIENEFPTFKYHLVERAKPFRLKHITDNLLNQLMMAGPLTGVLVFWKLAKFRIKNEFDRTLVFNIVGFYVLLFLLSFKNRIEAHWIAAIIPMLMLTNFPLIKNDPKKKYAVGDPVFAVQSKHLNPPNLQRMVTGEMKGFIVIEEFQSLKGLDIDVVRTEKKDGFYHFEIKLHNTNEQPVFTSHVSSPVLAIMQNREELSSMPLNTSSSKQKLEPGNLATIRFATPENKLDPQLPVTLYTRTKENIRGETAVLKLN